MDAHGCHATPVEEILRMPVIGHLYKRSCQATEPNRSDSLALRRFTRLHLEPAPDDTTLIRWAGPIGTETIE